MIEEDEVTVNVLQAKPYNEFGAAGKDSPSMIHMSRPAGCHVSNGNYYHGFSVRRR